MESDPTVRPLSGRTVAVFGASTATPGDDVWRDAETLGRLLAERGARVVTGGYGGAMEAACRGARAAGGHAMGITLGARFPERTPNPWLSDRFDAESLIERLDHLFDCDAFIVLEGSIGTLAELFVAWHHALLEGGRARPVVCLGERWPKLLAFLDETRFVERDLQRYVSVVTDPDAAVRLLEAVLAEKKNPERKN